MSFDLNPDVFSENNNKLTEKEYNLLKKLANDPDKLKGVDENKLKKLEKWLEKELQTYTSREDVSDSSKKEVTRLVKKILDEIKEQTEEKIKEQIKLKDEIASIRLTNEEKDYLKSLIAKKIIENNNWWENNPSKIKIDITDDKKLQEIKEAIYKNEKKYDPVSTSPIWKHTIDECKFYIEIEEAFPEKEKWIAIDFAFLSDTKLNKPAEDGYYHVGYRLGELIDRSNKKEDTTSRE